MPVFDRIDGFDRFDRIDSFDLFDPLDSIEKSLLFILAAFQANSVYFPRIVNLI